jgi:hypothetical protein
VNVGGVVVSLGSFRRCYRPRSLPKKGQSARRPCSLRASCPQRPSLHPPPSSRLFPPCPFRHRFLYMRKRKGEIFPSCITMVRLECWVQYRCHAKLFVQTVSSVIDVKTYSLPYCTLATGGSCFARGIGCFPAPFRILSLPHPPPIFWPCRRRCRYQTLSFFKHVLVKGFHPILPTSASAQSCDHPGNFDALGAIQYSGEYALSDDLALCLVQILAKKICSISNEITVMAYTFQRHQIFPVFLFLVQIQPLLPRHLCAFFFYSVRLERPPLNVPSESLMDGIASPHQCIYLISVTNL